MAVGAVVGSARVNRLPVVGGTGSYANAEGTLEVRVGANGPNLLLFRLRPS